MSVPFLTLSHSTPTLRLPPGSCQGLPPKHCDYWEECAEPQGPWVMGQENLLDLFPSKRRRRVEEEKKKKREKQEEEVAKAEEQGLLVISWLQTLLGASKSVLWVGQSLDRRGGNHSGAMGGVG